MAKAGRFLWKVVTWVAIGFAILVGFSVGLWALIGLLVIGAAFLLIPCMLYNALLGGLSQAKEELVKLEPAKADVGLGNSNSKARAKATFRLTFLEIVPIVIVASAYVYLIVNMVMNHLADEDGLNVLLLVLNSVWLGGLASIVGYAAVMCVRSLRKKMSEIASGDSSPTDSRSVLPLSMRLLKWGAIACVCIGGAGGLLFFSCAYPNMSGDQMASSWARFPLGIPEAIAVDHQGRVYCATGEYSRIQVYSESGQFVRGWFAGSGTSDRLWIDTDNQLHATSKGRHYTFSHQGELLNEKDEKDKDVPSGRDVLDAAGNRYKIRSSLVSPKIVKIAPDGTESVVVVDPWYLRILSFPSPMFLFWVVGIGVLALIDKLKKLEKQSSDSWSPGRAGYPIESDSGQRDNQQDFIESE